MPGFGGKGADAAEDAAETQADYLEDALKFQKRMYWTGRRDLAPYRQAGYQALNLLSQMYGLPPLTRRVVSKEWKDWRRSGSQGGSDVAPRGDMSMSQWLEFIQGGEGRENERDIGAFGENIPEMIEDVRGPMREGGGPTGDEPRKFTRRTMKDYGGDFKHMIRSQPGYKFRLGEGLRAIDRSASARGRMFSGGQLREITRYGQRFASEEYDKVASRLAQIAGLGGGAATSSAGLAQSAGQQIGSTYAGIGTARASGYVGAANARSQGFGNFLRLGGAAVGAYAF